MVDNVGFLHQNVFYIY